MLDILLKKKVSIYDPFLLLFFYPSYTLVSDINSCIDYSKGVVYTGNVNDNILKRLELLTMGNYILLSEFPEISLQKPSDFISTFFPHIKQKKDAYDVYSMDEFIPLLKKYFILKKTPPLPESEDISIFQLYKSMLSSKTVFEKEYISLLDKMSANVISSSLLTFLLKVETQNYTNCSPSYKKLINSAYLKFGNKITSCVREFLESSQKTEISTFMLIESLIDKS